MLRANTRWQFSTFDETIAKTISEECKISLLLARMLVIRGVRTPAEAEAFLHVSEDHFYDPFLLSGMAEAVDRIRAAIANAERICLYGDYDADGVSSTSLLIHVMRQLKADFDYYIPNRFTEGYGLHQEALKEIYDRGFRLVITVDTGISGAEQVAYANQLGLDVIITDHHEPPAQLPPALAVINPKIPQCTYPCKMLAGVGVALKLAHALLGRVPTELLDIAAIGTIADLVPLVDENRVIASLGLKAMQHTRNPGLQALIEVCELGEKEVTAGHVGFALGPRINAGGRLQTANEAVELLTTDDRQLAVELASRLDELNQERQQLVQEISEQAEQMVLTQFPPDKNKVLVLAQEGWNAGVIGIVASRMVEKFYRPTIVLAIDQETGMAKGSARSIAGFDLYAALTQCASLLPHYGGHTMAAGMSLPVENIVALREQLNQLADSWLTAEDFIPQTRVDVSVELEEIDIERIAELEKLAPFGVGNPAPLVRIKDVGLSQMRKIGRDFTHLKCSLVADGHQLDAVGFQLAEVIEHITPTARAELVGELAINEWQGHRKPQLIIRDLCVPERQVFDWRGVPNRWQQWLSVAQQKDTVTVVYRQKSEEYLRQQWRERGMAEPFPAILLIPTEEIPASLCAYRTLILYDLPRNRRQLLRTLSATSQVERIYCMFDGSGDSLEEIQFPTREQFKRLYQIFLRHQQVAIDQLDLLAANQRIKRKTLQRMLDIFLELNFIQMKSNFYQIYPRPEKKALEKSALYQEWVEQSHFYTDLLLSSHDTLAAHLLRPADALSTIS